MCGSFVTRTSPGASLLAGNASIKCPMAFAMELMWPGVPVRAWASISPVGRKTQADRSPASRTIGENAARMRVAACSLVAASSRFHIRSRRRSIRLETIHNDRPALDDSHVGNDRHDQRRFPLLNNERASGRPPWPEPVTVVNRSGSHQLGVLPEDEALPLLGAARRRKSRKALERVEVCGRDDAPSGELDADTLDDNAAKRRVSHTKLLLDDALRPQRWVRQIHL